MTFVIALLAMITAVHGETGDHDADQCDAACLICSALASADDDDDFLPSSPRRVTSAEPRRILNAPKLLSRKGGAFSIPFLRGPPSA